VTWFAWWAWVIIVWEALGLATGRKRWPPTITDTVRAIDPYWLQLVAIAVLLVPAVAHLAEWIA
jgi:hypothetical protein